MYIEFHARSAFSFLEGASLPESLIETCANFGMPAMALLDRDGVYGAPRFYMAAERAGIKAHIGAEINCENFSIRNCQFAIGQQISKPRIRNQKSKIENSFRLPLLVSSRAGYQNLCRLITKMKLRAKKDEGAVREDELREHAAGLVCLIGGDNGPLSLALARGDNTEARQSVECLADIFGRENVYVELQRHFHREQEARNHAAIEIARLLQLPLLATNGVSYATPRERELCDVFTAIRNHCTLATAGRLLARNSERHLKSPEEMQKLFADFPEAIANTAELSSRLEFTLKDLGYEFPKYPVPDGETMMSFLRERTREGFQQRYGRATADLRNRARQQVERELKLIEHLKLEGYFLIVWDLVRFCREQNILVQGRGSAANSAACYSLGITAIDPVGMDLLFERFLSEERGEWPDIDLDLPSGDQRERVIQYLYKRYGERGAAMTANVITYRNRMAGREMGKALGFDSETLDKVSSAVSTWEYRDSHDRLDHRFHDAGLDLNHPRLRKYFDLCEAVQDLPRHLGQHSGGMVICQGHLDSVVPLEPASMPGRVVVQWDKEDCADLGIIKVDLLGLGMMAALEDSIMLIRDHYGEEVDLAHLPGDDPTVYSTLQKADTIGMFQVESRAQMSCLPRLRPKRFYDIVVQVAIIRPGPIVGQMVNPFLQRRLGREQVTYPHPSLEPVLKRTLGVPLFQEQLLRMAMVVAGFSGGEAEDLRRAMGFKRSEKRMKEIEAKLRAGMERNGISREAQEQIVLSITSFALYGFPESHAASFALIAYASAYLKCHYLAAFTAALLNNQPMGFYQPFTVVKDAQRHGLQVKPVDVMKSDWLCTLEEDSPKSKVQSPKSEEESPMSNAQLPMSEVIFDGQTLDFGHWTLDKRALRLGLRYVKGLHEEAGQAIARARNEAPFISIDDLQHRVPELRKDELRKLAAVGALNFIQTSPKSKAQSPKSKTEESPMSNVQRPMSEGIFDGQTLDLGLWTLDKAVHRRDALWQVERVARPAGELYEELHEQDSNSPLAPMTRPERMDADFRGTGLTIGRHPVAYRRAELSKLGASRAIDLQQLRDGSAVKVGGWVIVRQRPGTAKGFVFLTMEDETGVANIIIIPQLFDKYRLVVVDEPFLLISGTLQNQDNVISVKAKTIRALSFQVAAVSSHDFH